MEFSRQSLSTVSRVLVAALVASLLVLIAPTQAPSQADYTSWLAAGSSIQHNNRQCSLGDPNNHSTSATAFEISTSAQLWEITDCVSNSATIYFKLANDIDVTDPSVISGNVAAGFTNSPIGFVSSATQYAFTGVLDGQNHGVHGISMSSTTFGVGLFAHLQGATISNLVLEGSLSTTTTTTNNALHAAGALAVRASNGLTLVSVSNMATVAGRQAVGGLIGRVDGGVELSRALNTGEIVAASSNVGGLIGHVKDGDASISDSVNRGAIRGPSNLVGGLVGYLQGNGFTHSINDSRNEGAINAPSGKVGGLIGSADGQITISSSHNIGGITSGSRFAGGLIGEANIATLYSVSNTAVIAGKERTGGLVGSATNFSLTDAINDGAVSGTTEGTGGLLGYGSGAASFLSATNTGEVSGTSYIAGIAGQLGSTATGSYLFNTGPISASAQYAGGLFGLVSSDVSVSYSHNAATVSAGSPSGGSGNHAGGLVAHSNGTVSLLESGNSGYVSSFKIAGGLSGVSKNLYLFRTFSTGKVESTERVGGFVGELILSGVAVITESYAVGSYTQGLPGDSADALVGSTSGTVTTASTYVRQSSRYLASTSRDDLLAASTYVGYDFDTVWGFGACTLNFGFPVLRSLGLTTNHVSSACGGTSSSPSSNQSSSPTAQSGGAGSTPPPTYIGPSFEIGGATGRPGASIDLAGELLLSVTSIAVGDVSVEIAAQTDGSITISLPESMPAGTYDLVVTSSYGQLTVLAGIRVVGTPGLGTSTGELLGFAWTGTFIGNSRALSEVQEETVGLALERKSEATTIVCWGYTTATEPKQWAIDHATQRAQAACDLVAELNPEVKTAVRVRYGVEKRFAMRAALQFWRG